MAAIPVVNTIDKRIGLVSALMLMLLTFIVLYLITYDIPNPLPEDRVMPTVADVDEIILKELVVEGGSGGGKPSDAPLDEPKPQTQQSLTQNTKPRPTSTNSGQANNTTSPNSNNTSSTSSQSNDPFGGGSGGGPGSGNGTGVGTTDGSHGTGPGTIGTGKGRTRLGDVDVDGISIETNATITYKLTVDSEGHVVGFSHISAKTTTTDQILINKIGYEIKKQVKYSKSPGSSLVYIEYKINVRAT